MTEQLIAEARQFQLRSACRDCFYWSTARAACWHGWPAEGQQHSPADEPTPAEAMFCKEFELK